MAALVLWYKFTNALVEMLLIEAAEIARQFPTDVSLTRTKWS